MESGYVHQRPAGSCIQPFPFLPSMHFLPPPFPPPLCRLPAYLLALLRSPLSATLFLLPSHLPSSLLPVHPTLSSPLLLQRERGEGSGMQAEHAISKPFGHSEGRQRNAPGLAISRPRASIACASRGQPELGRKDRFPDLVITFR